MRFSKLLVLFTLALVGPSCAHAPGLGPWSHSDKQEHTTRLEQDPTVMNLAKEIDHLEHHLDQFGTIVAKQPAIWGESRLTRHRQEFEKQMAEELGKFGPTMQGFIARSDQAYLAQAMSLSMAISGKEASKLDPTTGQPTSNIIAIPSGPTVAQTIVPSIGPAVTTDPKNQAVAPPSSTQTNVYQSPPFNPFGLKDNNPFTTFGPPNGPASSQLEPTVLLDQKARYLNHLNEWRRINESDDTADSPGYSLYLVRIPISVLPGKCTRTGHGAEITLTAATQFGDDLLPRTFRSLVLNDLIDLLGVPVFELAKHFRYLKPDDGGGYVWSQRVVNDKQASRILGSDNDGQLRKPGVKVLSPEVVRIQTAAAKKMPASMAQNLPTSLQRRYRRPLSPSQLVNVIGLDELQQVVNLAVDNDKSVEFDPSLILDVYKLLGAELEAAYNLVSQAWFEQSWWNSELSKQLAEAIQSNDLIQLKQIKSAFQEMTRKTSISAATQGLAWAVCVESALLNERFNEDMREQQGENGCVLKGNTWLPFYGPNPPPGSRKAFGDYVRQRWPIHIFALDPVMQDENIGDAFSRRRETQLALSLGFASGAIKADQFTRYARRLETDMSTIALHRTAAGFSHGTDTFGWRFYPRFQSPPIEGNATVLVRDLICGGPTRDQDLSKTQIDGGMRECVALVIMPSFVPYVRIDARSNWFNLTNPKCTAVSMAQTMRLSESIKLMESSSQALCDGGRYRDGEIERLLKRVGQLSKELPLQTLVQQVPLENTLGGFALFSHTQTDLAPQLTGFYGEPGVRLGEESTVFLVGDHFSLNQTQVLAGNKICAYQMLSRRCLQVTIPADVKYVVEPHHDQDEKDQEGRKESHDPNKAIDVHVATPYGVSGHIHIPVFAGKAKAVNPIYTWGLPTMYNIAYKTKPDPVNKDKVVFDQFLANILPPTGELIIQAPPKMIFPSSARLRLSLAEESTIIGAYDVDVNYDFQTNRFLLIGKDFDATNSALRASLQAHLERNSYPSPRTLLLTGKLILNANTFAPVESNVTIRIERK